MNIPVLIAATLSALTLGVHAFLGGPEIYDPVLASDLANILITVFAVAWHIATTVMIINSAVLLYAAFKPEQRTTIVALVSAQYLAWAGLFIFYGLTRLDSLWPMPQWIAFFLIPALALAGLWQSGKTLHSAEKTT